MKIFFFSLLYHSSSSMSSQDKLIGPLRAKCWPEAFHATFIHNIERKGEDRIGWRRRLGTTMILSVPPQLPTTTTTPPTLTDEEVGEESKEEEPQKT